jgi:hypothetical protein
MVSLHAHTALSTFAAAMNFFWNPDSLSNLFGYPEPLQRWLPRQFLS